VQKDRWKGREVVFLSKELAAAGGKRAPLPENTEALQVLLLSQAPTDYTMNSEVVFSRPSKFCHVMDFTEPAKLVQVKRTCCKTPRISRKILYLVLDTSIK